MKLLKNLGISIIVILSLIGALTLIVLFIPINSVSSKYEKELATPENPVVSPSGKYQLEVVYGYNNLVRYNRFYISKVSKQGLDPEVVFCSTDTFRVRDVLYFLWDEEDRVWVYSGDVGIYYWVNTHDTVWEKKVSANQEIEIPNILKELTPYFK